MACVGGRSEHSRPSLCDPADPDPIFTFAGAGGHLLVGRALVSAVIARAGGMREPTAG